mgnify:CR=1 FL=1
MKTQTDTDKLAIGVAFAYPGYLRIALRMLVNADGLAALDEFEARAKAAIAMGDDDPYPLAGVLELLAKDVAAVRNDPAV